jgi:adenosylcobinamide kinase/adenosylcobinamide-phosphate guanylyltransferase
MTTATHGTVPFPHFVLGGARSGKSRYAESLVRMFPGRYVYLATAQALDAEMVARVRFHRHRRGSSWETRETPIAVIETLRGLHGQGRAVLVDCLTLWLTNLLLQQPEAPDAIAAQVDALCRTLHSVDYPLVLVANEVGGGIVPENALARRFRDLAGWANQQVAAACPGVTLVVAGLPLLLKAAPPGAAGGPTRDGPPATAKRLA